MADNLGYTEGSGKIVRSTEDGDGAHHQHLLIEAIQVGWDEENQIETRTPITLLVDENGYLRTADQFLVNSIDGDYGAVRTVDQRLQFDEAGNLLVVSGGSGGLTDTELRATPVDAQLYGYYDDPFSGGPFRLNVAGTGGLYVNVENNVVLGESAERIGTVNNNSHSIGVGITTDSDPYASGDVMFATATNIGTDYSGEYLVSLIVIDPGGVGGALDILFFANDVVSLGSVNDPAVLDPDDSGYFLGKVSIAENDYIDIGGVKVATIQNVGLVLMGVLTTQIGIHGIARGAYDYDGESITIRLGTLA
jgi:hypothetical protein